MSKGVDINATDNTGETVLYRPARYGRIRMAELLIDKGADINAKNNKDQTPLDIAVSQGHTEIAELLRKHGAKEEGEEKAPENVPAPKEGKETDPNFVWLKEPDSAGCFGRIGGLRRSLVLSALF